MAQSVYEGFKRLGTNPSYIRFTSQGTQRRANLIAFELRAGEPSRTIQLSDNSTHYAVQVGERIYAAMTGPTGLLVTEYMQRLFSPGRISMHVVDKLP